MQKSSFAALKAAHSYQQQVLIFSFIILMISNAILMCLPLLMIEPKLQCYPKGEFMESQENLIPCQAEQACSGEYDYIIDKEQSINSLKAYFNLICEDQYKADLVGSASFLGNLLGCLHAALFDLKKSLSKPLWLASLGCGIITLFGFLSFSIEIVWAIVFGLYYLVAIVQTFSYSHSVEVTRKDPILKDITVQVIYGGAGLASVYGGLLGLISSDWQMMFVVYTCFPILFTCMVFRRLSHSYDIFKVWEQDVSVNGIHNTATDDIDDVHHHHHHHNSSHSKQLGHISRYNEHPLMSKQEKLELKTEVGSSYSSIGSLTNGANIEKKPSVKDLINVAKLRILAIKVSALEIITSLIYYGAHLAVYHLESSLYLNLILMGLVEFGGDMVSAVINRRFRRKPTLYVLYSLCCVNFCAFYFIEKKGRQQQNSLNSNSSSIESIDNNEIHSILSTILVVLGKLLITIAYSTYHTYLAEVSPGSYLTAFFGVTNFLGAFFLIIIPQIITITQSLGINVYVIFGLSSLIPIFILQRMRETKSLKSLIITQEKEENMHQEMKFNIMKDEDVDAQKNVSNKK